ncbi:MAG TPA: M56 family metallopeptidase [Fimbriimonas sp.]|nr:M56 family metallopeptidase [Fimbriimonas sp.]
MIFVVECSVKSLVIVMGAWIISRLMRKGPAASRHLVWLAALVMILALPVLQAALPGRAILPPQQEPEPVAISQAQQDPAPVSFYENGADSSFSPAGSDRVVDSIVPVGRGKIVDSFDVSKVPVTEFSEPPSAHIFTKQLVPIVWVSGSAILGLLMLLGLALAGRLKAKSVELGRSDVDELREKSSVRRPVRFLVNGLKDPRLAMTWGFIRPLVMLPKQSQAWPAPQIESVLMHELAHVRRLDWLTQWLASAACAVFWFNPAVWFAARRLREEAETAADDFVLRLGRHPSVYANDLLLVAAEIGRARPRTLLPGVTAMKSSRIEKRIEAILAPSRTRRGVTGLEALVAAALAMAAVVPLATARPDHQKPKPSAKAAKPKQTKSRRVHSNRRHHARRDHGVVTLRIRTDKNGVKIITLDRGEGHSHQVRAISGAPVFLSADSVISVGSGKAKGVTLFGKKQGAVKFMIAGDGRVQEVRVDAPKPGVVVPDKVHALAYTLTPDTKGSFIVSDNGKPKIIQLDTVKGGMAKVQPFAYTLKPDTGAKFMVSDNGKINMIRLDPLKGGMLKPQPFIYNLKPDGKGRYIVPDEGKAKFLRVDPVKGDVIVTDSDHPSTYTIKAAGKAPFILYGDKLKTVDPTTLKGGQSVIIGSAKGKDVTVFGGPSAYTLAPTPFGGKSGDTVVVGAGKLESGSGRTVFVTATGKGGLQVRTLAASPGAVILKPDTIAQAYVAQKSVKSLPHSRAVQIAKLSVAKSQAQYKAARDQYQMKKKMYDNGAYGKTGLDRAELEMEAAECNWELAKANLAKLLASH